MDKNYNRVLKAFIDEAKNGNTTVDIFDIRYETSLSFKELDGVIVLLEKNGEVVEVDRRYYKFIGDINRTIELEEEGGKVSERQEKETADDEESEIAKRRAYLEERRRQLLRRLHLEDDDDNEDDEGEEEDDDEDDDEFDELSGDAFSDDDPEADENSDKAKKDVIHMRAEVTSEDYEVYDEVPPEPLRVSIAPSEFDPDDTYAECVYRAMIKGVTGEMLIQSDMPIGYTQTMKILRQMQGDGYIKPYRKKCGHIEYKAVITEERFRKRFCANSVPKEYPPEFKSKAGDLANVIKAIADKNEKERCDREYADSLCDFTVVTNFHYRWADNEPGKVFVSYGNLGYKTGELAEFRIIHYGDTAMLSDNGYAFNALRGKNGYGKKRAQKQIRQYVNGTVFDFTDGNELRIEIGKLKNFVPTFFLFYWTIVSLL